MNTTAELIDEIRRGRMVVLMDDEGRENEGDLVMAAEAVSPEDVNFMASAARGLICLTLTSERCRQLGLPPMVERNDAALGTNFTASIDAAEGISTGISAADRARTIRCAVAKNATPRDVVQPGHIFPLRAENGGVLTRAGHTEAGCDLARFAGMEPAAVIVEIMKEDGSMARRDDLLAFAERHELKIGTIADLIEHRMINDRTVAQIHDGSVQTEWGEFRLRVFRDHIQGHTHLALLRGDIRADQALPVRVHVPQMMRDLLDLRAQAQSWSVRRALRYIAEQSAGVLVIIGRTETAAEMEYSLSEALGHAGDKPPPAPSARSMMVGIGAQILRELGVGKMHLMANPAPYSISGFGLEVEKYLSPGDHR